MGDVDVYPTLLDMTKDECRRILRNLELEAYSNLVSVLRAQGSLSSQKKRLLQNVAQTLSIPVERHKAECRRAVASEKLATIAKYMEGPNTATDWAIEGRRLVPLMPRLVPQTAFTALADQVANIAATEKAKFPPEQMSKTSEGMDENVLEEPSTPEASKTIQLCVNPAAIVTTVPSPSPCATASSQVPSQEKSKTSCQPNVLVPFSNNEDISEEKISRKRGRAASVDARSCDVFGSMAVQPPSKKFQENVDVNISRPHATIQSVPTQPSQPRPSQRTTVKHPAKSPTIQPKLHKPVEHADFQDSEKAEDQSLVEINSEPQTLAQPSQSTSHIVQSQATPGSTVARVVPNHVKLSLASPTQGRTVQSGNSASTPAGTQKVIIVSSTTQSILQRSLSVPLVKAATSAAANNQKQSPVVLNSTVNNQPNSQNQQHPSTAQNQQEKPSSKPNSTSQTVLIPQSTSTAAGTTVPATTAKSLQNSSTPGSNSAAATSTLPSTGTILSSKFPQKARSRGNSIVIPMTLNQAVPGGGTVSNVQLKTLGTKPTTLHLKQDSAVKIMPITSGTKILPKPSSGQMFLVSSASGATPTVSMVTKTVPAGTRVMAVNSPNTPRVAVNTTNLTSTVGRPATILSMTSKPNQAVQMGLNSANTGLGIGSVGTPSKPNVIVVQKSSSGALSRGVTLTHGGKEVIGKVLLGKAVSAQGQNAFQGGRHSVTVQKFTNTAAMLQAASGNQSHVNLPVPSSGNVIVLDLSQEQLSNNAMLSEILQGIIPSSHRNVSESVSSNVTITTSSVTNTTAAKVVKTKEDTPLPCVSSDWLQTSDITGCVISDNSVGSLDGLPVGNVADAPLSSSPQGTTTTASPSVVVQSVVPSTSTGMDIFSTALSSADINLDSFQYLEDSSLDGMASQLGVHSTENSSNSNSTCLVGENSEQSLDAPMDCD